MRATKTRPVLTKLDSQHKDVARGEPCFGRPRRPYSTSISLALN